jgi:hypothetical protein
MSEQLDQGQATTTEAVGGADQQPAAQPAPELTVQDLSNLRAIIDVSAQRGAFRASEMEAVGAAFNKLSKFLDAVAPQQAPADQQQAPADQPAA